MINLLIADDNISYAINLMNYIHEKNENVKVCSIAKNGKEALELLNMEDDIDIVLLDYKMPIYTGKQVLEQILNKRKYRESVIMISEDSQLFNKIKDNEMIYSVTCKAVGMEIIIRKINEIVNYKSSIKMMELLKNRIIKELLYLGYDISQKGTRYLIEVIEYVAINSNQELEGLEKNVYPKIAMKYGESVHNIKCRINNSTTSMYYNCKIEKLKNYFHFDIDTKPKIRTIINTVINNIN